MNKKDIFKNAINGTFLELLSHVESIETTKAQEINLVKFSLNGFQSKINIFT